MKATALHFIVFMSALSVASAADQPVKKPTTKSPGIVELLEMADAGVSADVMKSYVEGSTTKYSITANEVILMKEKGISDEVTAAVLKRMNDERQKVAAVKRTPPVMPRIVQQLSTPGRLDPESYEFFLMHHLYPRTLSSSYSRLGQYQPNRRSQNRGRSFRGRGTFRRGLNDR